MTTTVYAAAIRRAMNRVIRADAVLRTRTHKADLATQAARRAQQVMRLRLGRLEELLAATERGAPLTEADLAWGLKPSSTRH